MLNMILLVFLQALQQAKNPGVSISYDFEGNFQLLDIRMCLESFVIGPQTIPVYLKNLQAECLVDIVDEDAQSRNFCKPVPYSFCRI
jgi:hypothetical protein